MSKKSMPMSILTLTPRVAEEEELEEDGKKEDQGTDLEEDFDDDEAGEEIEE